MKETLYSTNDLLAFLKERGLPASRMWLRHKEAKKLIVCPRRPNTRGDRALTMVQMEQIAQAFSPGGKGYWKYI